jgi:hypothetical protein
LSCGEFWEIFEIFSIKFFVLEFSQVLKVPGIKLNRNKNPGKIN